MQALKKTKKQLNWYNWLFCWENLTHEVCLEISQTFPKTNLLLYLQYKSSLQNNPFHHWYAIPQILSNFGMCSGESMWVL